MKKRGLDDSTIEERYRIISDYEAKIEKPIDYEKIVGKELWEEYKNRKKEFFKKLTEDQAFCDKLNKIIMDELSKKS